MQSPHNPTSPHHSHTVHFATRYTPHAGFLVDLTPGPLHILVPPPAMLFLWSLTQISGVRLIVHLLSEAFPDHPLQATPPISTSHCHIFLSVSFTVAPPLESFIFCLLPHFFPLSLHWKGRSSMRAGRFLIHCSSLCTWIVPIRTRCSRSTS